MSNKKSKIFSVVLILFITSLTLILNVTSAEIEIPNYQNLYVNDFANILTQNDENYLQELFYISENETTAEITFVSIQTCAPLTQSEYAQEIGDKWKVGKEDKDNGLIILYCYSENKIWIATGYGLEGILPDSKIGRILDEQYVPYRDINQTSEGIIKTSEALALIIEENKDEILSGNQNNQTNENETLILYLVPSIMILIMLISQIIHYTNTQKLYPLKYPLDIIFWLSIITYIILGISITIISMFVIYYLIARGFLGNNNLQNGKGGFNGGGFSGGGFSGGGSFGGGSFGGGGAGR